MKEGMVALTLRQDDIYKASNPKEFERFNVMLEKQVDFHRALVLESWKTYLLSQRVDNICYYICHNLKGEFTKGHGDSSR